jgi:hypothetical protein
MRNEHNHCIPLSRLNNPITITANNPFAIYIDGAIFRFESITAKGAVYTRTLPRGEVQKVNIELPTYNDLMIESCKKFEEATAMLDELYGNKLG